MVGCRISIGNGGVGLCVAGLVGHPSCRGLRQPGSLVGPAHHLGWLEGAFRTVSTPS